MTQNATTSPENTVKKTSAAYKCITLAHHYSDSVNLHKRYNDVSSEGANGDGYEHNRV